MIIQQVVLSFSRFPVFCAGASFKLHEGSKVMLQKFKFSGHCLDVCGISRPTCRTQSWFRRCTGCGHTWV